MSFQINVNNVGRALVVENFVLWCFPFEFGALGSLLSPFADFAWLHSAPHHPLWNNIIVLIPSCVERKSAGGSIYLYVYLINFCSKIISKVQCSIVCPLVSRFQHLRVWFASHSDLSYIIYIYISTCIWNQGFDGSPVGSRKHAALEPRISRHFACVLLLLASCLTVSELWIGHLPTFPWIAEVKRHCSILAGKRMVSCIPDSKDMNFINHYIDFHTAQEAPSTCQGASPSHGTYLHAATAPKEPDTKSIHHSKTTTNSAGLWIIRNYDTWFLCIPHCSRSWCLWAFFLCVLDPDVEQLAHQFFSPCPAAAAQSRAPAPEP